MFKITAYDVMGNLTVDVVLHERFGDGFPQEWRRQVDGMGDAADWLALLCIGEVFTALSAELQDLAHKRSVLDVS